MSKHIWKDQSKCLNYDTNLFFDTYEEDETLRPVVDKICLECPVLNTCFAVGISNKEWGVWGGVYLTAGSNDKLKNLHMLKTCTDNLNKNNNTEICDISYNISTITISCKILDTELNIINIGKYLDIDNQIIGIKYYYGEYSFDEFVEKSKSSQIFYERWCKK